MNPSLDAVLASLALYRYVVLLPLAIVEGPIVSVLAGFLASLGKMDFFLAYGLLVLGDVIGDMILYGFGRWGGSALLTRIGSYFGATPQRMEKIKIFFRKHARKTLLFGKWGHAFGFPILVTAGVTRYDFSEFVIVSLLGTLPKSLALILIGFYFGKAYVLIDKYIAYASFGMAAIAIVAGVAYWIVSKYVRGYFEEDSK